MHCLSCGFDNSSGIKFCGNCGTGLKLGCGSCGFENAPGLKFCGECGKPLLGAGAESLPDPRSYTPPHLADRILAEQAAMEARGAAEGERKTITALFADIKGSVELMEDLDPEEARSIVDPALRLMMEAVHGYEGYVAQSRGDGILALFGAPLAHEDHPRRALHAAMRMQEKVKRYAEELRRDKGVTLEIRVGINTGEVVVRSIRKDDLHTDYVPIGHSTNLAARLESLATPGSILVSEETKRLTDGYFEFRSLGAAKVKGVSEPIQIFEVAGVGPLRTKLELSERRGLTRFVGRQTEMQQLRRALASAKQGRGQIVGVVGEPGVGKSRLFHEFQLGSGEGCLILKGFAVSHGKALPYLPLLDLVKAYFTIALEDDEQTRREKIAGKLVILDDALRDALPYFFRLLGVAELDSALQQTDPQLLRQRTFESIKRVLLREGRNRPVIVVLEDLHWVDNETDAFLAELGESLAAARILLLVNYRPEYEPRWGNRSYSSQLRLDPLERESAEEMLTAMLGDEADLLPVKRLILEKSEGTPFFMEEIVQGLFERGIFQRNGKITLTRPLADIHIPPTVQGVLAARIDRLAPALKELLQVAAVIGREFSLPVLRAVTKESEERLRRQLAEIQAAEFVYEQPASTEIEYIFKHALTRDVAYDSVLVERRSVLHELTAKAIEDAFASRLEDHYGELAHHYSKGGNVEKAIEYLELAGKQAAQRFANAEAIAHLEAALRLLASSPASAERNRRELGLQLTLGPVLKGTRGFASPEVEQAYARARALCAEIGDRRKLAQVLVGLAEFYAVSGDLDLARETAEECLSAARDLGDDDLILEGSWALGTVCYFRGEFSKALEHFERGIGLYDPRRHRAHAFLYGQDPGVGCLVVGSRALWHLGYPDRALRRVEEALKLARDASHLYSLAFALANASLVEQFRRDASATLSYAEASMRVCSEQGYSMLIGAASILHGWALAEKGEIEKGVAQIRRGWAMWRSTRAELEHWPALLVEALHKAGQFLDAATLATDSLTHVRERGLAFYEAELHRLKGEALLSLSEANRADAEGSFRRAIEIARRQEARSFELRAVTSLARLLKKQGKSKQARQMLTAIYGWFTEGFDTADLKDAKALLEELS